MMRQKPLPSARELRQKFDAARESGRAELESTGSAGILRCLSDITARLQQEGLDVGIDVRPGACANAYHLLDAVSGPNSMGSSEVKAYGFLRFGSSSRLFAIANQHNGVNVERLYLSYWNSAGETETATPLVNGAYTLYNLPGRMFDFGKNANAAHDLAAALVETLAEDTAVLDHDASHVFNKDAPSALHKPRPKLG